jgi:hypothetical protein
MLALSFGSFAVTAIGFVREAHHMLPTLDDVFRTLVLVR